MADPHAPVEEASRLLHLGHLLPHRQRETAVYAAGEGVAAGQVVAAQQAVDGVALAVEVGDGELLGHEDGQQQARRQAQRQSRQADEGVDLVLQEVAEGDGEIAAQHGAKKGRPAAR